MPNWAPVAFVASPTATLTSTTVLSHTVLIPITGGGAAPGNSSRPRSSINWNGIAIVLIVVLGIAWLVLSFLTRRRKG